MFPASNLSASWRREAGRVWAVELSTGLRELLQCSDREAEASQSCCRMYCRQYWLMAGSEIMAAGCSHEKLYIWNKKCSLPYIVWDGQLLMQRRPLLLVAKYRCSSSGRVWAACNPCNRSLDILQTSSTLPTSGGAARGCSREIHPIVNVSEFLNNVNYLVPFVWRAMPIM